MRRHVRLLLTALALAALPCMAQEEPAGTPDTQVGLAKGSVFEVLVPAPVVPETSDPGERPSVPPEFEGSPPRVPHGVEDHLPVTREDNLCVDCHGIAEAEEGDPTPIPASHYVDLRNAPDEVGETLQGARWVCLSCHVPLTGTDALVGNVFDDQGPAAATPEEGS